MGKGVGAGRGAVKRVRGVAGWLGGAARQAKVAVAGGAGASGSLDTDGSSLPCFSLRTHQHHQSTPNERASNAEFTPSTPPE